MWFSDLSALQGLSLAEEFQAIDSNLLVTPFSSQLYLEIDTSGQEPRSTFRLVNSDTNTILYVW